jgi:methanogenic corrinoid protein MtbC1
MGKHIESMMNQLIKTYHDMDQDKKVSNSNMRFAANYMSSIKVIYAKFSAFNSRLGTEIAAAQYALKNIKPVSKAMFDKIAESKPEMAEKYKERGFV